MMDDTVRIFIGSSANGEDNEIEIAYEHSIRKNISRDIEITWMRQTNDTESVWGGWNTPRWSTPFSGFRWAIPEVCNFKGRAIYSDVDMINYRDIAELFDTDMKDKPIAARRGPRFGGHEFCVMLFDCAKMKEFSIPVSRQKNIAESHHRMIARFSGNSDLVHDLDPRWNCLDGETYSIDEMWQLHFTKMNTQPWKPGWFKGVTYDHPRKDVIAEFNRALQEAINAGYNPNQEYGDHVEYNIIGQ